MICWREQNNILIVIVWVAIFSFIRDERFHQKHQKQLKSSANIAF